MNLFVIFVGTNTQRMIYKILAKINKAVLPSYSKRGLDPAKASKLQLAIIGWRYYVTIRALDADQ